METTLLQELSQPDLHWLLTHGKPHEIVSGTILIQLGQPLETLYILLEGTLTTALPETETEINWLSEGDMVGALPGLESEETLMTVRAATNSWLFMIPQAVLQAKCHDDAIFAAHIYRASAVLLANQLVRLTQQLTAQVGQPITINPAQHDSIALFAALHDDDLDWLAAVGQVQQLAAETILVESGQPLDAWYILLEGAVAFSTAPVEVNSIMRALMDTSNSEPEQECARLSRGDTIGEYLFVHPSLTSVTAKAVRETQLLAIPRWRLAAKLLHDSGFAARFYQVLTVRLANKQRTLIQRYCGQSSTPHHAFDNHFLTRMALAEARFEWLLKRMQTKTMVGGGMKW